MKPRVCVSIALPDLSEVLRLLDEVEPYADMFEIRLDHMPNLESLGDVVEASGRPVVATNRPTWEGGLFSGSEEDRLKTLVEACSLGFDYADVELRSPALSSTVEELKSLGVQVIVSVHEFDRTPSLDELRETLRRVEAQGADVAKVVGFARRMEDNLTYLKFLSEESRGRRLVSFGMGPLGVVSRVLCPLFGGYYTYACPREDLAVAPGQLPVRRLLELYRTLGCLG